MPSSQQLLRRYQTATPRRAATRQIAREDRLRQEIEAIGEGRQASAAARS
jgi:hypothetical protein